MFAKLQLRIGVAASLAVMLAASPILLSAQAPSSEVPPITIRTSTRLVVLDVVVTDKKGQPVTGLKADDFVVEESGKKQRVATFTPPGTAQAAAEPLPPGLFSNRAEYLRPAGNPTVLLLDAANSRFRDQAYGRLQMLKYVSEQSGSGTPMAVVALTDRLHVLQEFTSDPKILAAAIRNLKPQEQVLLPESSPSSAAATDALASGPNAGVAIGIAQAELAAFQNLVTGYNLEVRTIITVQAMRDLSRLLAGFPGRKNVVWLTSEFPFDLIPEDRNISDAELRAELPGQGKQRMVGVNAAGAIAAEARELHGGEIMRAESQLASANIAIYPVDMRGIMMSGIDVANSGTMEEIAAETGGKAYTNQNEIKFGIALAASDDKASYSIGYYPENKKWDGKYRSIKVKLNQPDTQVRCRKGYFAIDPGEAKDRNYSQDVAAALAINAPSTQISFRAQAKPTGPNKVQVIFLVDARTLSAEDSGGNKKMNVTLYAALYNSAGKDLTLRTTKVDRAFDAATYQQIVDKGMMVPIDMDVPSGTTELRLAVLDGKTGYIGTATGPIGQ
ncbi:MAG: VWA domain-containing protein [Terriglobales bacterium]|jgi:VWFA-related protein